LSRLRTLIERAAIPVEESFFEKIEQYKALLAKWNKIHNLTGAKSADQIDDFIVDALFPITFLPPLKTAMDI